MATPLHSVSLRLSLELSMQNAEGGSDSPASVTLCPSAAAQAPVAQPVPASPQVTEQPPAAWGSGCSGETSVAGEGDRILLGSEKHPI